jgi:hydroxymethylpyrimidine/phosphomethylpyrimidine kinase
VKGRVLVIAGSDSSGGAGIQADIKTITALGGYAMSAITALTAQNTQGVFGIHPVPESFIAQQMELAIRDIGADCVKTGMLHSAAVIDAVVSTLAREAPGVPLVVDPVMIAKGGAPLLEAAAIAALKSRLIPRATVVTPNLPEAQELSGISVSNPNDMRAAGHALLALGAEAVLVKGGHLPGRHICDVLVARDGSEQVFENERIDTRHTHGTGCTLASAIATGLAQSLPLLTSVRRARDYVLEAIRRAPGFGHGHGPLNHAHSLGFAKLPPRVA